MLYEWRDRLQDKEVDLDFVSRRESSGGVER